MERILKNKKKWGSLLAILFVIAGILMVILTVDQTRAWLFPVEEAKNAVKISDFKISGKAYFGETEATTLENISLSNPDAPTYLGNLKYVVEYSGISPAMVRIRILEQWVDKNSDVIKDAEFTQYQISTASGIWYDNRKNDYCYYYMGAEGLENGLLTGTNQGETKELVLFDGVDMANIQSTDGNTEFKLIIQVEAVQPNRFREFFDIEKLPWK